MAVLSSSRLQTLWAQIQTGGARAIPNSSGTWTSTGVRKQRFNSFGSSSANALNTPTYKTGTRSPLLGVRGRQGVSWNLGIPLIPSGAAGTAPDADPILQSIMGAAGVVVASTTVTYSLGDALYHLFLSRYNKTTGATSPTNNYVLGGIVQSFRIIGGGNFLDMEISGAGIGAGDSVNFAGYTGADAILKGGLTTYPAEPGSATQNGNVIPGFAAGAGFTFGGSTIAEVRGTVEISGEMGVDVIADTISDAYPYGFVGGLRQISISRLQCVDSDSSLLNALKQAAYTKAASAATLTFGNVAGSIVTINLANLQIGANSWSENGAALDITFDKSDAHETSSSVSDDLVIQFS
jgi:hypothetical protein